MGFISFGGLYFCLETNPPPQAHAWLRPWVYGTKNVTWQFATKPYRETFLANLIGIDW